MKKIFNLIVCAMVITALSSCVFFEDKKSSKDTEGVKNIVELPDSIKQKIVEQNALMTELLNKVDTLRKELNITKANNAELKEKIVELENPRNVWTYTSLCAFLLGLIALVVSLFRSKGIKEERVKKIAERCFGDNIKEIRVNVNNLLSAQQRNNRTTQGSPSSGSNADERVRQLEIQMSRVLEVINNSPKSLQQSASIHQEYSRSNENHEYRKVGYAKVDTDIYFTTIYESNQEGCVFKINFTSQTKGRYNIIALDKIQSRNDWQKKVECSGGVSIKEASDFRLEEEGVCEKIDDINWKVTKPLRIRLLK